MERRTFLGSCLATVAGLLGLTPLRTEPALPETKWVTCVPMTDDFEFEAKYFTDAVGKWRRVVVARNAKFWKEEWREWLEMDCKPHWANAVAKLGYRLDELKAGKSGRG